MKTRIIYISLLVWTTLSMITSCVEVNPELDDAVKEIEKTRQTLEKESSSWRDELKNLEGNLSELESKASADTKSIIADSHNHVSDLLEQSKNIANIVANDSIAKAGIELRCNTDFLANAISDQLQYLIDDIKFWDINRKHIEKPIHRFCTVNPDTIRLYPSGDTYQIDTSNMQDKKIIKVYGYNFRSDIIPSLDLYDAKDQMMKDLNVTVDYITQYQMNLNFANTDWEGVVPGASVKFNWGDKSDDSRISLSLLAPAKLKLSDLIVEPAVPIAAREEKVGFAVTVTNVGEVVSGSTILRLKPGIENGAISNITIDPIQPGVSVEKTFPDDYVYPENKNYYVTVSLDNGDDSLRDIVKVYNGYYCSFRSLPARAHWSVATPPGRISKCGFLPASRFEVVDAGGCVNTGGEGLTSRHYISPLDENGNPDLMHYGMIAIPGSIEKNENVSIQYFMENIKSISVGEGSWLWMGYLDDSYNDNSYYHLDNGYFDQCKDQPAAYIVFKITLLR